MRYSEPKPRAGFDTECTKDYWLIYFKSIDSGSVKYFEFYDGHPLDRAGIIRILRNFTIVGFNSTIYDIPMLRAALRQDSTPAMLKKINDFIITRNKKPWETEREFNLPEIPFLDHIDVIEPAPSVQVGLKLYMARLHSKRIQDLPFDPDELMFDGTPGKRERSVMYCGNDVDGTIDVYHHIEKQIELRCQMSDQYGVDLRSKSDAQIAEAVLRHELERIKGDKLYRPEFRHDYSFNYIAPPFIRFKTQQMREVFHTIKNATFRLKQKQVSSDEDDAVSVGGVMVKISGIQMPVEITGAKAVRDPVTKKIVTPKKPPLRIHIGDTIYKIGIGGLHSTESAMTHHSDDDCVLVDNDVASYYPSIMLVCELFPDHLGRDFLDVYRTIKERRIAAKRAKDKVSDMTLKIVLNGTFGKLGSKWSVLYAPNLMLQVTITGQLALLMLIEELELAGISVISANTDGIVSKCPRELLGEMRTIIDRWQKVTGFDMEPAVYSSLYSRDVNNYLAVKAPFTAERETFRTLLPDWSDEKLAGEFKTGVKQKGRFAFVGSKGSPAEKNPTNYICIDAVINYLTNGMPLEDTIEWCPDVRRFLAVRRVTGGATYKGEYVGKVVRWYQAKGEREAMHYAENGNLVPTSTGARPLMELDGTLPNDIDYDYYRNEAIKMLGTMGVL